eukprot:gene40357-54578_t
MKNHSGWSWDDINNCPDCDNDVWIEYIKAHKDAKCYKRNGVFVPFMWYQECEDLFAETTATGLYARRVGSRVSPNLNIAEDYTLNEYSEDVAADDDLDESTCTSDQDSSMAIQLSSTNSNFRQVPIIQNNAYAMNANRIRLHEADNINDISATTPNNTSSRQSLDTSSITSNSNSRPPLPRRISNDVSNYNINNNMNKKPKNGTFALANSISQYSDVIANQPKSQIVES